MSEDLFGSRAAELTTADLDDVEIRHHWPAALAELLDVLTAAHVRAGESEDTARTQAVRAVRAIATHLGGRMIYLPKGRRLEQALRDREIWERFNGRNVRELSQEYGLTEVRIYEILREQRSLARARRQPELFDADHP